VILFRAGEKLYPRPVEAIDPDPDEPVRAAILTALREESQPVDRWAAAALEEGVDAVVDE
jgi:uncharacterized caspase-like protein